MRRRVFRSVDALDQNKYRRERSLRAAPFDLCHIVFVEPFREKNRVSAEMQRPRGFLQPRFLRLQKRRADRAARGRSGDDIRYHAKLRESR